MRPKRRSAPRSIKQTPRPGATPKHAGGRPHGEQAALLSLQRAAGNRAVVHEIEHRPGRLKPKTAPGVQGMPVVQRGFWKKVKKAFSKAGRAIKRGFKKAGRWIAKGAKKAWGAITKGAKKVWTGLKWVSKQLWSKLKGILLRVRQWFRKLPTRLKRLVRHVWKGVKALRPWSLNWWRSLGKSSTWASFGRWLGNLVIYGLETMGIGEAYETVMDFIKFNTRPLAGSEKAKARRVFDGSIPLDLVRVDSGALLGPSWTKREYVSFHTINGWGGMDDHTLIHELTHVWQYNTMGARYMPKAIHAQSTRGSGAYDYGGLAGLETARDEGRPLTSFNMEEQAQIVADYYERRWLNSEPLESEAVQTYKHFADQVR